MFSLRPKLGQYPLHWGKDNIEIAWWLSVFPGLAILITVLSYNLMGEGLRDALDPRLWDMEYRRMIIKGRNWKFGNDIDTDAIIPARHLNTSDPAELAKHIMEDADKDFQNKVKAGRMLLSQARISGAAHQGSMRRLR